MMGLLFMLEAAALAMLLLTSSSYEEILDEVANVIEELENRRLMENVQTCDDLDQRIEHLEQLNIGQLCSNTTTDQCIGDSCPNDDDFDFEIARQLKRQRKRKMGFPGLRSCRRRFIRSHNLCRFKIGILD